MSNQTDIEILEVQQKQAHEAFSKAQIKANGFRKARDAFAEQISFLKYKNHIGRCYRGFNSWGKNSVWDIYYKVIDLSGDMTHFNVQSIEMIPDPYDSKLPKQPSIQVKSWPCNMVDKWKQIAPETYQHALETIILKIKGEEK